MSTERKICVVTGTRADYGLLKWIITDIKKDPSTTLQIIATGMHLSPEFGSTYKEIEGDGFTIDRKIEILLSSDTVIGTSKSIGLGVISFSEAYSQLDPDIVIVLGDRFETLAATVAATIAQIPIAHLHGGEITEGAIDEAIRHSITKMAHLHFTSTEAYKNRVIQLGEQPDKVFNVGAPGLEALNRIKLLDKEALEKDLGFTFGEQNFLVTYHPVTLMSRSEEVAFNAVLSAFESFPNAKFLITYPNADASGRKIIAMIQDFADQHPTKVYVTKSLGQLRYLSTIQFVDAVVGNSSSALIEAPSFGVPSVNIGSRQGGRISSGTVIHCGEEQSEIVRAMKKSISVKFKSKVVSSSNVYGDGNVAKRIVPVLKEIDLQDILIKKFNDLI